MIPEELTPRMRKEAEAEFGLLMSSLYPLRRDRRLSRLQFADEYKKRMSEVLPRLLSSPLLVLQDAVERTLVIVALAGTLHKKTYPISVTAAGVRVPRGLQRPMRQIERDVTDMIGPLLDPKFLGRSSSPLGQGTGHVQGSEVNKLLFQYAFLRLFTAIEVYLQDILVTSLADPGRYRAFSENLQEEDIPKKWPDGTRIRVVDYALRWNDVITIALRFPYHEFEGRVSHRYRACFGFDLRSFPKLNRLVYFRQLRHRLVHQGATRLGVPLVDVTRKHVLDFVRLSLELADFVEHGKTNSPDSPSFRGKRPLST